MKVLAIDGGGIRGLIPALVLAEIERRTGRRIATMVDLIAGTSTGAILACALAKPDPLPAQRIADIYREEGPRIFARRPLKEITSVFGYLDERYDASALVAALRLYLGDARLADATTRLLITAYDLEQRQAVLLRSGEDITMVDAAHASSAAPTYFEPVRVGPQSLVDGGVGAVNPSTLAFAEAGGSVTLLASLGTGEYTRRLPYDRVKDWGQIQWARPILDVVFDAGSDFVELELSALLGAAYVRLQTRLTLASDDLDDAGAENMTRLSEAAAGLIRERSADIDRVCAALTA